MWEKLSDADLVAKSELIVRGDLVGTTRLEVPGQGPLTVAGVRIRGQYKGAAQTLVLVLQPSPERPVSSSDIRHPASSDGLWFLRPRPGGPAGVFMADHPQRFVSEKDDPKRFAALLVLAQALPPTR